jgi:hypothetical protein
MITDTNAFFCGTTVCCEVKKASKCQDVEERAYMSLLSTPSPEYDVKHNNI